MQRIIQINIAGRLIPIEEDAYIILKEYLTSLERQFNGEEGRDEIIEDIEHRIAELFSIRLQGSAPAIDKADVKKVMDTLGHASELNDNAGSRYPNLPVPYFPQNKRDNTQGGPYQQQSANTHDRLFRNPNDKMLGGVCSGIANYFDIDPVFVRLVFVVLFLTFGMGLLAYIIAWVVIPVAKTPEQLRYMSGGEPMNFHDIKRNVGAELKDLKGRGEEMSRELRDFFSRKK